VDLGTKNTASSRPGNVTTKVVKVTNEWWGDFNYRAFNIAKVGATVDISKAVEETASHFRIYVPK
jgi:hypothetical protein